MMSVTAILSRATPRSNAVRALRQASLRILSSLPTTRSTSAMSANICACVCAAQPVTTIRASGRSRLRRRIDCRACATASLVTAQLLMTMVSERPALSASRRITSDSNAFSRQPKVTISTGMISRDAGEQRRVEFALVFELGGAGHQHMVVALAPFDVAVAARQCNGDAAVGALQARRRHGGCAGRRAAGLGQPRAALPGANRDVVAVDDMGERDIGALREDRVIFQQWPEAFEVVGVDVLDPEDRMRIAHADH